MGQQLPSWMNEVVVYDVPTTTSFRGIRRRQGMLILGDVGWAEWSPFPEYPPAEAARWLQAAREQATQPPPPPRRLSVPVNVTVPAIGAAQAHRLVVGSGCHTAKVKVAEPGHTLTEDLSRVGAVREALGPRGAIRVDANGHWTVEAAHEALRQLAPLGLDYVEQPCCTVEELAELRRRLRADGPAVRIAADESIRRSTDPEAVARLAAADVVVLKVQPLGGISACMRIARTLGLPVVISSALETSIGLQNSLVAAAALPELGGACGLNTGHLLGEDTVEHPLTATLGQMRPRESLEPAPHRRWEADEATTEWWLQRLHACLAERVLA